MHPGMNHQIEFYAQDYFWTSPNEDADIQLLSNRSRWHVNQKHARILCDSYT